MRVRRLFRCGVIALLPASVWAQDPPGSPPPVDEQGSTESGGEEAAADAASTPQGSHWGVSLSLRESWQKNPRLVAPMGNSSFVDDLGAGAFHTRQGSRGQLSLRGQGSASRYHRLSALNRLSYSAAAAGSYRLSPRVRVNLQQAFLSSYTRGSSSLTDAGLFGPALPPPIDSSSGAEELSAAEFLLPLTRVVRYATNAGITSQLGAYTTASANLRYTLVRFDAPALIDGSVLAARTTLNRRFGTGHSLGISYGFERNRVPAEDQFVHTASADWARRLSPRWSGNAAVGVSYLANPQSGPGLWTPRGSAGLIGRFQGVSVDGRYSRSFDQTFGLGRALLTDSASVGIDWSVTQRAGLLGTYQYGLRRDPSDPSFRFTSQWYSGTFSFKLNRDIGLGLGYSSGRRTSVGTLAAVRSESAYLSMSYGRLWQ